MQKIAQVVKDLNYVFDSMPVRCLENLRDNRHRLVRRAYRTEDGRGCIFSLLTEVLPLDQQICSRSTLTHYFGGNPKSSQYAPAKWLVRFWDGDICEGVRDRYGDDFDRLEEDLVFEVLEQAIHHHQETSALMLSNSPPHRSTDSSHNTTRSVSL